MKFNILWYNVRGLNEPSSIATLRQYIQQQHPSLDLLCLQETKLRHDAAQRLGRSLWRRAQCWSYEASAGYTPDGRQAGRGGTAILLGPKWRKFVSATGSFLQNRACKVILSGIFVGDIGFLNIYAPNDPLHRCVLWETILRELPRHCQWIMLGDFNMVEARRDKSS